MISKRYTLSPQRLKISTYPKQGVELRITNIGQTEVAIGGPGVVLDQGWTIEPGKDLRVVLDDSSPVYALCGDGASLLDAIASDQWQIAVENRQGFGQDGNWQPGEYEVVLNYEVDNAGITYESLPSAAKRFLITRSIDVLQFTVLSVPAYVGILAAVKAYVRPYQTLNFAPFYLSGAVVDLQELGVVTRAETSGMVVPDGENSGVGVIKVSEFS